MPGAQHAPFEGEGPPVSVLSLLRARCLVVFGQGYGAAAAEAALRGRPPLLCPIRQPRQQQHRGGWEEKASKVAAVGDLGEEVSDLPALVLPVHGELWAAAWAPAGFHLCLPSEGLLAAGRQSGGPLLDLLPPWGQHCILSIQVRGTEDGWAPLCPSSSTVSPHL